MRHTKHASAKLSHGPGRNAVPAFQRRRREEAADEAVVAPRLRRRGGPDSGRRRESHDAARPALRGRPALWYMFSPPRAADAAAAEEEDALFTYDEVT